MMRSIKSASRGPKDQFFSLEQDLVNRMQRAQEKREALVTQANNRQQDYNNKLLAALEQKE